MCKCLIPDKRSFENITTLSKDWGQTVIAQPFEDFVKSCPWQVCCAQPCLVLGPPHRWQGRGIQVWVNGWQGPEVWAVWGRLLGDHWSKTEFQAGSVRSSDLEIQVTHHSVTAFGVQ